MSVNGQNRSARNCFAFRVAAFQLGGVIEPLALVYFQKPLPGNQLVARLRNLNYRVQVVDCADELESLAKSGVMLVLADHDNASPELVRALVNVRQSQATSHIPIIVFSSATVGPGPQENTGNFLAVESSVLLQHLESFLEQALRVE
mgnify:FL=1